MARSATETTRRIVALVEGDRQRVLTLGRAAGSAAQIHQLVTREVVFTIPEGSRRTGLSEVTVAKAAAHLQGLGIVRELTGKPRNKLFAYDSYLALLQEGTQPGR